MNDRDRRTTWETYARAWKEARYEDKRAALAESVSETAVYRDPTSQLEGHDALLQHMVGFHQQVPGGWFETIYFLSHHDRSIARWNMHDQNDAVIGEGISYAEYDRDGKLVAMTGFFETPSA